MQCPVCALDMFVLEFERVEVDYCHRCGGVWLDSGELELIGDRLGGRTGALQGPLVEALESPGTSVRGDKRPCPVCARAMKMVSVQTTPTIVVDRCPHEHGLWFDRGELGGVVRAAGAEEDNLLARFFAELDGSAERNETS